MVLFLIVLTTIIIPYWFGIDPVNNCEVDYDRATRDPMDNMREDYCTNKLQILLFANILFGGLFLVLIYIVWSLIQKKS